MFKEAVILFFVISLGLTVVMELAVALLWRVRRLDLALVALVNVLTNPLVVLLHWQLHSYGWLVHTILPEVFALAAETIIYYRLENSIRKPLLFALVTNLVSYATGFALQWLLYL